MVLPIGLIALAATAGIKPYYDQWAQGITGRRAAGVLDEAGNDPEAQAQGFLRAGMLTPDQYLGHGQQAAQLAQQQAQLAQQAGQFQQSFGLDQERLGFDVAEAARNRAMRVMGGGDGFQELQGPVTPGIMDAMKTAVAGIESGGAADPYRALGPVVPGRGQALGKYQVMPENVASWTQLAGLPAMTPEEFLNSPEAQEAVFEDQMSRNLNQYGTIEDALSVWHSGRPAAEAMNASDGYMKTADYIGRGAQVARRQLGLQAWEQQQQQAIRGADLEAEDAAAPSIAAADNAETVLQGLDDVGRFGSGYLNTTEGKAQVDQMRTAGMELFYTWKKQVYGDAEPSPITLEQLQDAFPAPGASSWENRERTARFFRVMKAELEKKAEYDRARVLYSKGLMDEGTYRSLNGGRLTRQERAAMLRERADRPARFSERVE